MHRYNLGRPNGSIYKQMLTTVDKPSICPPYSGQARSSPTQAPSRKLLLDETGYGDQKKFTAVNVDLLEADANI